jgi:isochorismate hydrolase
MEGAVLSTALGLLQRDKRVILVTDAIGTHNNRRCELALRKMKAKGAKLIETRKLAGLSHLNAAGICHCKRCRGELTNRNFEAHSIKA